TIWWHMTGQIICSGWSDKYRDESVVWVVEDSKDVIGMEKMKEYKGTYHVLHGSISPMDGIGPEDINVPDLISRLKDEKIKEIIIATNPNIEGEATAMYISRLVRPSGISNTRMAHGLHMGGDLEYADEVTLAQSLEVRHEV